MPSIPKEQRGRVAHFLEKQGFKAQALAVATDPEHRFELAVALDRLDVARTIATELDSELKWKQLGDKALSALSFALAEDCYEHANDFQSLLLIYTYVPCSQAIDLDDLWNQSEISSIHAVQKCVDSAIARSLM